MNDELSDFELEAFLRSVRRFCRIIRARARASANPAARARARLHFVLLDGSSALCVGSGSVIFVDRKPPLFSSLPLDVYLSPYYRRLKCIDTVNV